MGDVGLAVGSFDLFHVGHLDALRAAAAEVDRLVIGVADDDLVARRRGSAPMVPLEERLEVVDAFFPDAAVQAVSTDDAAELVRLFGATQLFVCVADVDAEGPLPDLVVTALPYRTTTSESVLRTVEADVLWMLA